MAWVRSRPPRSTTSRARSPTCTRARTTRPTSSRRPYAATRARVPALRIDPLTGLRTIVAGERADRPGGGFSVEPRPPLDPGTDPFLAGHEDRTPPEIYARRPGGGDADSPGWTVRVVPNLYPALSPGDPADTEDPLAHGRGEPQLFASRPAVGGHEVIVNAPQPVTSIAELDVAQLETAMDIWRER